MATARSRDRARGEVPTEIPLPRSTQALILQATRGGEAVHPGLRLDKYLIPPPKQEQQRDALLDVASARGDADLLAGLNLRRDHMLSVGAGHRRWRRTTEAPLTLHLARASALENAGICLHPIHGFTYLPGTGLKGLARAFAETAWLPARADKAAAWRMIEDVFGWAPNKDRAEQVKDAHHPAAKRDTDARAGGVVFHDAWPAEWPALFVDIVNNHHPQYYQQDAPPGDWDEPNPVYFLAVRPGATFDFALGKRRDDTPTSLLELAGEWLDGALTHLGCGAKTNAGYGGFRPDPDKPDAPCPNRVQDTFTLELTTPGFFAGASQDAADCDLRSASLRGQLRWWWRTLHAGFVSRDELAKLEAAVWGDTEAGGAVRTAVVPAGDVKPLPYDRRSLTSRNRLPEPPNKKTTQGLTYHSYGMDESKGRRHFLAPGTEWRLRLTAQAREAPAELLAGQARCALWLFCSFGGLGGKSRKGFGSFAAPEELRSMDLKRCQKEAADFRVAAGLGARQFGEADAASPAWPQALDVLDIPTQWTNVWYALDQIASSAQSFAQGFKHDLEKQALGLPRRVGRPTKNRFHPGEPVKKSQRHAAPTWYHLVPDGEHYRVRVVAFPSGELPNLKESQRMLGLLLGHLKADLPGRAEQPPGVPRSAVFAAGGPAAARAAAPPAAQKLKAGDRVEAVLLEEKTKKGGWKAKHEPSGLGGPIQNSAEVPGDKNPGDKVSLLVASVNAQQIAFKWPKDNA